MHRWILVLEPNDEYREVIISEAAYCQKARVEVVCVSFAQDLLQAMSSRGSLPEMLIVDWFGSGDQVRAFMEGMRKHGILSRLRVVAIAGEGARRALIEAQDLGVRRFICKHPDESAFRKKISEAIRELIPVDKLMTMESESEFASEERLTASISTSETG